jgi:hypothetical protein
MMKLSEIINVMESHTDENWSTVMGVNIPGLAEAEKNGEQDDWKEASRIEAEYLQHHENDIYAVCWPEHVTYPRFNSDATYHLIQETCT